MAKKLQKWLAMCLVVCMCMSMFTIPAAATEQTANCGKTAHSHGEACYTDVLNCEVTQDLTCVTPVHEHDSDCYHVHSTAAECYAVNCKEQYDCEKQYDCTEEHEHVADCAAHVHGDACSKHTHIDTCYACEPSCEIDTVNPQCDKDVHVHGETCYVAHVHGKDCSESKLTCTVEVHTHDESCFTQTQSGDQTIDQIPALMTLALDETQPSAQSVEPITGTITENMTWDNGAVIGGVTIADDVTITVNGTVTVVGTISMGTDSINTVTIQGGTVDAKLIRGNGFTGQMFYVEGTSYNFQNLYFRDLTLDGGAVWRTGEEDAILKRGIVNDGISATGSILYLARANATLDNCVLQNQDDGTGEKANAVFLYGYATIAFNDSVVRNNNSPSGYWKGGVVATRYGGTVTANNSDVYGNSAAYGGFVGVSSSGSYGTKVECVNTKIHNNYASTAGAAFYLQDNGAKTLATFGDNSPAYLKLTGCTLKNNGSPDGLIHSYQYYTPAWINDTTIADNACSIYTYGGENRSFSVAGSTQISSEHSDYLYEAPVRIYGALDANASIPMNEKSVSTLMSKYGYLATATPRIPADIHTDIPQHYNHTGVKQYSVVPYEYTSCDMYDITLADLAQVQLYEGNGYTNWVLTDVDGNGMLDAVPVNVDTTTVNVTLNDTFKGANETQTQKISTVVKNVPVCYYEHTGYFFNGWLMEDGTLIKDVNSNTKLTGGEKLTATWAVARPRVTVSASTTSAKEGQSVTLSASISNMDTKYLDYTYQWYRDGVAIDGETNTTLTVTEADAGYYVYKCEAVATDKEYTSNTNTYYDYIILKYVVPGYKVTYHTVDTKTVTNAETNEQTTEIVTTPVHEEFLLIPKDKTYDEVDLFATPYSHYNSDNTKRIKSWYTKYELNSENKVALSEEFVFATTEVTENIDLYGNTWVDAPNNGNSNPGSSVIRPSGGGSSSSSSSSTQNTIVIEDERVPLAGGPNGLNTVDHIAYLAGFGDGTLRPYDGITRGQVATIFFRLLTDEARAEFWSETNDFTDCGEDLWCNTAISTLSNMGIIDGYQDGTFKPNAKVTRAQFAKIMVGFFGVDQFGYTGLFSDVAEDAWHSEYVETASRLGLIQGYTDGTFKPNANITRAQACVIVNRALVRVPDEEHLLPLDKMLTWTDNTPDDWFYADMMEATNSHDYMWLETETETVEQWTEKLAQPDWAKLEKVWSETYGG